ncbi:MAG TPA: 50S ribosomal protein L29 [Candidatus Babeliales bacterium]|nr:50S ribosomal protein L29 [Candidatus Babeliales bacterium]
MKRDVTKKELEQLSLSDLKVKIDALRRELFSLRINATTSHIKDYSQFKKLRKDIARALTYIKHKESLSNA